MLEERENKTTKTSSRLYLLLLIIYFISLFFPIVPDYELIGWGWTLINFTAFLAGGYIGMVLLFISYYYISKFEFLRFLTMSIIGSIAVGINYALLFYIDYLDTIQGENAFRWSSNFYINFGLWIVLILYNFVFLNNYHSMKDPINERRIRKAILNHSTKVEKLFLKEFCKKLDTYDIIIIRVIHDMLKSNQINGEYFKVTKTLQLCVKENLEEIDKLMALYKEWEDLNIKKNR